MRLGAISLLVADYEAAIAWFTASLGFALAEDTNLGGGKRLGARDVGEWKCAM